MTRDEAIERIKQDPSKKYITEAISHQERVRFFTTTALEKQQLSDYQSNFFDNINRRFDSNESYGLFENHITYPLQTTEYVKGLYSDLKKIFEASNPFIDFAFETKDNKDDAITDLNIEWFKTKAYESFMKAHNSIIIIDTDDKNELKYFLIDISSVEAIEVNNNIIEWIIFTNDKLTYYAYDNEELLVLKREKDQTIEDLQVVGNPIENSIGITPAVFLIDKNLRDDNEIVKQSLISDSLGAVEEILIDAVKNDIISDKIVPVVKRFRQDCEFDNGVQFCVDGYLKTRTTVPGDSTEEQRTINVLDYKGRAVNCPQCAKGIVPGSTISEPYPETSEEKDILNDALQYVTVDKDIFEVADERLRLKKLETKNNILGAEKDLNPKLNHNEVSVLQNTESRENVLKDWKNSYEKLIKSVMDKFLSLKYSSYKGSIVNLGTSFFLTTFDDVLEEKKKSEESGLNAIDYDDLLISTKHKNDPEKRKKAQTIKILSEVLRPLNRAKREEVADLYSGGKISEKVYQTNANFFDWINRFEIELNDDITTLDIDKLIKDFKDKLVIYFNEIKNDGSEKVE